MGRLFISSSLRRRKGIELKKNLLKIPAISFYYHYYLALTGTAMEANFKVLKELIFTYHQQFPSEELRDLYIAGINVCIRILNI